MFCRCANPNMYVMFVRGLCQSITFHVVAYIVVAAAVAIVVTVVSVTVTARALFLGQISCQITRQRTLIISTRYISHFCFILNTTSSSLARMYRSDTVQFELRTTCNNTYILIMHSSQTKSVLRSFAQLNLWPD